MKKKVAKSKTTQKASEDVKSFERKFSISIFADEVTLKPRKRLELIWTEIIELFQERELRPQKSGRMLGGYKLKNGGDRRNANVLHHSLTLIDIDTEVVKDETTGRVIKVTKAAPPLDEIRKTISTHEWVATSTHSHEASRGVNKFRIALVPDRDIKIDEHQAVLEALDEMMGGILDRAAWGLSQAFYLPSCPEENAQEAIFFHNEGAPLCVDELVLRGREIIATRSEANGSSKAVSCQAAMQETPENIKYVESLLNAVPANVDRTTWRDSLWAVASLGWKSGEELAREWSETAPEKYDAVDFDVVWQSFDPTREKKVGFGTLVHIAKKFGATVERPRLVFTGLGVDIFNGKKFAELFRGRLLHIHETNQWLIFDPHQGWVVAPPGEAERSAKFVVKVLWDELADAVKRKL